MDYSSSGKKGKLYIKHLRKDLTEENLKSIFGEFGKLCYVRLLRDRISTKMYGVQENGLGLSTGKAFVLFSSMIDALKAYVKFHRSFVISDKSPLYVMII